MSLTILYATLLALMFPLKGPNSSPTQKEGVNIGLLVQDTTCSEVILAARLAIEEANQNGGYKGQPFKLVIRTTEGPWGAGSKESVNLVYEDDVRVIVGSLDGRNAHLAEQVAARSHLVYLETRATDPTLSQAFVPWFFRVVPNDNQQSMAILDLIETRGGGGIAILYSEQYDARHAIKSLTEFAARRDGESPLIITLEPDASNLPALLDQINTKHINHLVIPFFSETTRKTVSQLRQKMPALQIYGTLAFTSEKFNHTSNMDAYEGVMLVQFYSESYDSIHNQLIGIHALYTYDGMNLVVEAIRQAGLERESIKEYLLTSNYQQGATGPVSFDDMGNRKGKIRFIQILNGHPAPVN